MNEFEEIIKEKLAKLYEEEENQDSPEQNGTPPENTPPSEEGGDDTPPDEDQPPMADGGTGEQPPQEGGDGENQQPPEEGQGQGDDENGEKKEEENFSAENLGDFLKKTESKTTVKKEGCMPSPIFGNKDTKNHNKFRVYIENPKGKVSFIFWDSITNTEKDSPLDTNEALADFGRCISDYEENPSFEEFKETFGYSETDADLAQKAYNGCRKMVEKAKKIFSDAQIEELKRLASEY